MDASHPLLLLVDDDDEIRTLISSFLVRNGFRVETAADGAAMRIAVAAQRPDMVLLDVMLPDADGLSLLRELRQTIGDDLPVIMITAAGEEVDRIVGLEVGADDYLPKPFNPRELLARVRAVFRRAGRSARADAAAARPVLRFAGYELDPQARSLRAQGGAQIDLTTGEFELLLALGQRPNRVLSRDQLMSLVKGDDAVLYDRSIDAQISRLRRKIEADPEHPLLIKTVRNIGYIFSVAVT